MASEPPREGGGPGKGQGGRRRRQHVSDPRFTEHWDPDVAAAWARANLRGEDLGEPEAHVEHVAESGAAEAHARLAAVRELRAGAWEVMSAWEQIAPTLMEPIPNRTSSQVAVMRLTSSGRRMLESERRNEERQQIGSELQMAITTLIDLERQLRDVSRTELPAESLHQLLQLRRRVVALGGQLGLLEHSARAGIESPAPPPLLEDQSRRQRPAGEQGPARKLLTAARSGVASATASVRAGRAERDRLAPLREADRAVAGADRALQDLEATLARVKRESDGLLQRGADAHRAQVAALAFADGRWLRQRWEWAVSSPEERVRLAGQWKQEGARRYKLAQQALEAIPGTKQRLDEQLSVLPANVDAAKAALADLRQRRDTLKAQLEREQDSGGV